MDNPVNLTDEQGLDTAMCTRRLNNVPFRFGPLYHEYVCTGNAKTGYSCKGLGPTKGMFDSPGKLEDDEYKPKACSTELDDNECVESCIQKRFASALPNYSVDLSHGDNCQTYANDVVSTCMATCKAKKKELQKKEQKQ